MNKAQPTVALLSDQKLFRQGILELLHSRGFYDVRELDTVQDLRNHHNPPPQVLVVDLDHEEEDTMTLVRSLRHDLPRTSLVMIGSALRQGAVALAGDGEIETPRADAEVLAAVVALEGRTGRRSTTVRHQRELWARVTPRQRDVLRWLAVGFDNGAIAAKLHLTERAVKAHISGLLATFARRNRTELALLAQSAGLRPPGRR